MARSSEWKGLREGVNSRPQRPTCAMAFARRGSLRRRWRRAARTSCRDLSFADGFTRSHPLAKRAAWAHPKGRTTPLRRPKVPLMPQKDLVAALLAALEKDPD